MTTYSIKDMERLSGVKAHTIRVWEQRYEVLQPKRTATNIRFYEDDHLKKLLNVQLLLNNGHKISKVANLPPIEFEQSIRYIYDCCFDHLIDSAVENSINAMVVAMINFDEKTFTRILSAHTKKVGFERAIPELIYPFMTKIGSMWSIDEVNPAQEHFVSNIIRQKILTEIDRLPLPKENASRFMLFLPEGEHHEIGLMVAHYLVKKAGNCPLYLGANVPLADLGNAAYSTRAETVLTISIIPFNGDMVGKYSELLNKAFPTQRIIICGNCSVFAEHPSAERFILCDRLEGLQEYI